MSLNALTKRVFQNSQLQFQTDLEYPFQVQSEVLQSILQQNQKTEYGEKYSFSAIHDASEYVKYVPICDYEALSLTIDNMTQGLPNLLTAQKILAYEETGGSNGGRKKIPYTLAGLEAFQNGLVPWISDLYEHYPNLRDGKFYWAISPACRKAKLMPDGTPVGLEDAAYFGEDIGSEMLSKLAVPVQAGDILNIDLWHEFTLFHLLKCESLSFISVWSPSFLIELLRFAVLKRESLAILIEQGEISDDQSLSAIQNRKRRSKLVLDELGKPEPSYCRIWGKLQVISCWDSASATIGANTLRSLFPKANVQGKGLLATEALVTIPLIEYDHPVLALRSAFFEFIDSQGNIFRADQLEKDNEYQLLITTHSGLYRYNIGDMVSVRGFAKRTPMLEFMGRSNATSDICGEKLNDAFVMKRIRALEQSFAMLAPSLSKNSSSSCYVLLLDQSFTSEYQAVFLASALDKSLSDNPQYSYARQLGQLGPVVSVLCERPLECWLSEQVNNGQRLGDIKIPALLTNANWIRWAKNVYRDSL